MYEKSFSKFTNLIIDEECILSTGPLPRKSVSSSAVISPWQRKRGGRAGRAVFGNHSFLRSGGYAHTLVTENLHVIKVCNTFHAST